MERERLGSRLGFILLSAGCAIGLGNIWKFPYMVGEYGGGAFVLVYLVFLAILGIPVLCMELSIGRGSRSSPLKMFGKLQPEGSKWNLQGYACMAGTYLLMAFYVVVTAWLLIYMFQTMTGMFAGLDAEGVSDAFDATAADPVLCLGVVAVVTVLGFTVCSLGVQNGLERVTKPMMILMLVIMVFLAGYALTMPGAMKGLEFYLVPDFDRMMDNGIWNVIVAAMSQAFFTLSLGIGSMAIFGSYASDDRSMLGESVRIASVDLFVAFTAGLIIFPACFAYGVEVDAGPSLIFETLPNIFIDMPYGEVVGTFFFLFMFFAALSTVFAVFEAIVANVMELTGWDRKKTCIVNCIVMFLLIVPCALGFGILSGIQPMGPGSTIMDLEDFIVSFLLLPIGALIGVLFCTSRKGWGWERFKAEANKGEGAKIRDWMRPYMTYVMPLVIIAILVAGLLS